MADSVEAVIAVLEALLREDRGDLLDASVYAILARLRRFNRDAHAKVNEQRQSTMDARNAVDQTHLGLQNLLYERRHLEREIQKCREFQFIYQDIPLYSLEEFTRLASAEAATPDEHELMKNRLEFEFAERARLEERKKMLINERDQLLRLKKENRVRMDTQTREENELAKKATNLGNILSELTITSSRQSPAQAEAMIV